MSYPFAGRLFNKYKPFFPYEYKDYSFKLDLEFGELYFTKKLISFSGKHLPFNLSLHYIYRHSIAGDDLYIKTGLPRGFKINYHVFLEYDSAYNGCYKYEDADGFEHIFKKAENTPSDNLLYFDTQGSGLMLKCLPNNSGFQIFDEDGNYQEFDSGGRLVSINKKINDTLYASQHIYYQTDLKISLILDNYYRAVSFAYTNNSVTISYNNNVIITLSKGSALLTSITKNIGGNHSVIESFTHSTNPSIKLTNISLDSGESFSFTYDDHKILNFVTNIKQDVFSFSYGSDNNHPTASVTNARGIATYYEYGEKQLCSRTYENNSPLSYSKVNSEITSCLIKTANDSEEIIDFLFGIDEETRFDVGSYSFGYSQTMTNHNLQAKKMYLLVAEIEGNLGSEHFDLALYDYDNNLLAKLIFSGSTKVLTAPVGIKASSPKSFSVSYANFTFGLVTIVKVRLLPLIGDFEIICTDINTYGPIFFYENTPYYQFPSGIVDTINNAPVGNMEKSFTATDLLVNERLFYKRDNHFHFWTNDKKDLFDDATSVFVLLKSNFYIGFDASYGKIALYDTPSNRIADLNLYRLKGADDNSFSVTKISHDSSSFHTGCTPYYYEEMETKYVAGAISSITYYDYQAYYLLKEVNRHDGYKEEYYYDSHLNLIEKHTSHTNINEQIKNEYNYGSYDELTYDEKLVGSSYIQTNYSYDTFGNVIQIDFDDYTQLFTYDNVSGERDLNVTFSDNESITIEQDNNYVDESSKSLSSGNNTYLFTYDAGRLMGVSYNDTQLVSLTHYTPVHSGYPLNTRYVIQYMNGYYATCEKDAYDRVISNEGLFYTYNEFSKVTNIYDDTLGGFDPNTSYTYDYYNDLVNIDVERNALSLSFVRDIYRRIISKTYNQNNNSLYQITYTYYAKPSLEKVIKESHLLYNQMNINIIDNLDDFSRLTNQTITFSNYSFSKSISYCNGGPNNSLTNQMIKSVLYPDFSLVPLLESYSYDSHGNIIQINRTIDNSPFSQVSFEYDAFSRLVRENNTLLNRTYTYIYNSNGNITSKKEYAYSLSQSLSNPINTWTYGYDQSCSNILTSFNNQQITYDVIGNPLTYKGKTLSWTRGTLLSQVIDGGITINLTYDGFKQRIAKTVTISPNTVGTTIDYSYINGQLIKEVIGNKSITYLYAHIGVIGFILSGFDSSTDGTYFYEKNIQQDVESIRNSNNQSVAIYQYDAWGNHKVLNPDGTENTSPTFIGNINPIRYRSYYYDTDLKMYWLTTRYYDSEVGRFISPDHYSYLDYQKLHGLNLYAYSKNNPVMYYDPSGHFGLLTFFVTLYATVSAIVNSVVATAVAAGTIYTAVSVISTNFEDKEKDKNKLGYDDFVDLGGGVYIYYQVSKDEYGNFLWNEADTNLKILDSWQYSQDQIEKFVDILIKNNPGNAINKKRIVNEWMWHKIAFYAGIDRGSTRSADIFLDAKDNHNNAIVSFIMNNFWWFY